MAIRAVGAPNASGAIPVEIFGERLLLDPDDLLMTADGQLVTVTDALNDPNTADLVQRQATQDEIDRMVDQQTSSTDAPVQTDAAAQAPNQTAAPTPSQAQPAAPTPSASTNGGGGAASPEDTADPEDLDFDTVPPDAEVWHIDGKIYLSWEVLDPATGERVGMVGWHVTGIERWNEITASGADASFDFDGTIDEAEELGFIDGGIEQELGDFSTNPLETFYEDYEEQFALSPIYGDPEILGLLVQATMEGRDITDAELAGTDYWSSRTEQQRAWDELVLKDPATAAQRQQVNRDTVRAQLMALGYSDAPESLVSYLADNWTTGLWSDEQLQMQLVAEVDPYSANASPFAGVYDFSALGAYGLVTDGEDYWVRTENGDYRLDGPGQVARFGEQAEQLAEKPEGQHVIIMGTHYLLDADGNYFAATGPGQIAGLERLYGPPVPHPAVSTPPAIAGTVVELFGGAGGIEKVGEINEVGTAQDLVEAAGGVGLETTQLGGEEEIRNLLRQYVGPYHAANYSDEWVAEWAGRIRNGPPGTRDLLVQELQRSFRSLFPGYDENDFYESVAAPARGLWSRYSGNAADENDPYFLQFLQMGPDAVNREGWLRSHGRQSGWAPVVQQSLADLGRAFGPQVSQDLLTGVY